MTVKNQRRKGFIIINIRSTRDRNDIKCYKCGENGHIQRMCKKQEYCKLETPDLDQDQGPEVSKIILEKIMFC